MLTEREKWLMKQAWEAGVEFGAGVEAHGSFADWLENSAPDGDHAPAWTSEPTERVPHGSYFSEARARLRDLDPVERQALEAAWQQTLEEGENK